MTTPPLILERPREPLPAAPLLDFPADRVPLRTRCKALGQVVFCLGCCCGRTDRGHPPVPVDRLKEVWRAEHLNATVQLTISGCLGPCDLANVALVMVPEGDIWLGGLERDDGYDLLIEWARRCRAAGQCLPLPPGLNAHRFERFDFADQTKNCPVNPVTA